MGKKANARSDEIVRQVAEEAFVNLVKLTPVDTGAARGNWRLGVNRRDTRTDKNDTDRAPLGSPPKPSTMVIIRTELRKVKFGDAVNLTNGLPYIPRLERGYSKQSHSMLGRTLQFIKVRLQQLVYEVQRKHP